MSYLSRLAAQTGLVTAPAPLAVPPTLEVIEEVAAPVDAPVAPHAVPGSPAPQDAVRPSVETVVQATEPNPPVTPDTPSETSVEITQEAVETSPAFSSHIDHAEPPNSDIPPSTPADELQATPEEAFNIRIQQVFDWVAQNDTPAQEPNTPDSPLHTIVEERITAKNTETEPPKPATPQLEIRTEVIAPEADPVPSPSVVPEVAIAPSNPTPSRAAPEPTTPAPSVVEERIDIAIGTIELSVTPPPQAPRPVALPAPVMAAAPQSAPLGNRMRRRYVRF